MIRRLDIESYPEVIELWKKSGLEVRLNGRDSPENIKKQITSGNVILLGKFKNLNLLGVVLITHDERKGWINRLAVDPENQNKGIAKELISSAEKILFEEKGIEVYCALVSKGNLISEDLFEGIGYEKWEEIYYFSKRIRPDS